MTGKPRAPSSQRPETPRASAELDASPLVPVSGHFLQSVHPAPTFLQVSPSVLRLNGKTVTGTGTRYSNWRYLRKDQ
ncbi:hypothetical protein LX36DRAFT_652547 [Colletotrichum falcatum]|nr:hypothetical protein LX36DRAFT_652547 [Colletotrichum falcatum]